jgi:hypothetical protein
MAFEKEQSYKCSRMAALVFALIWIVFLPVSLVVMVLYQAHVILSSRKLGVSATALLPMTMRWLHHQLGLRRDEACAKLIIKGSVNSNIVFGASHAGWQGGAHGTKAQKPRVKYPGAINHVLNSN